MKRLEVIQNKALQTEFDALWYVSKVQLYADAKIPTIQDTVKDILTRYYSKASVHSNPLVRAALAYDKADQVNKRRPKAALTRLMEVMEVDE